MALACIRSATSGVPHQERSTVYCVGVWSCTPYEHERDDAKPHQTRVSCSPVQQATPSTIGVITAIPEAVTPTIGLSNGTGSAAPAATSTGEQQQQQQQQDGERRRSGEGTASVAAAGPGLTLSHKIAHKSVTGAVRVAVRGLGGEGPGLRRSSEHQGLPHHHSHSRRSSGPGDGAASEAAADRQSMPQRQVQLQGAAGDAMPGAAASQTPGAAAGQAPAAEQLPVEPNNK
jgi:hypothetical protein